MRAALLAIMVLRHLRLWLLLLLRLLWLLWLRPGTTPLGATTRAVEPIGPTLGAATIRAARTTLAARTTGAARIKVCAKSIGRVHTRTDPGASSCPGAGQSSLFFPLHRLQLGCPLSAGRLGSLLEASSRLNGFGGSSPRSMASSVGVFTGSRPTWRGNR